MAEQECSTSGCARRAVFTTRTRPAWCEPCMIQTLAMGGLIPVDEFPGKPSLYWRTCCAKCATVADYRLEYVLDKNSAGEPTCRTCYWIGWAAEADRLARRVSVVVPDDEISALANENDYDVAALVLGPTRFNQPVVLRCRSCDKLKVSRVLDIHWGCDCSRARRRVEKEAARLAKKRSRKGFIEPPPMTGIAQPFAASGLPAIAWWDHHNNPDTLFQKVLPSAKKIASWVGPTCGHRFNSAIALMATEAVCPICGASS